MAKMKKKKTAKPGPVQQLILDYLAAGRPPITPYRLAKVLSWPPSKVYPRLRGTVQLARIEEVLRALGGELTIGRGRGRRRIKF